jgi:hypothetical protein
VIFTFDTDSVEESFSAIAFWNTILSFVVDIERLNTNFADFSISRAFLTFVISAGFTFIRGFISVVVISTFSYASWVFKEKSGSAFLTFIESKTLLATTNTRLAGFRVEIFVSTIRALFNAKSIEEELSFAAFSAGSVFIANSAVFSTFFANSVCGNFVSRAGSNTFRWVLLDASVHEEVFSAFVAVFFVRANFATNWAFLASFVIGISSLGAWSDTFIFVFNSFVGASETLLFVDWEETTFLFSSLASVVDLGESGDVLLGEDG